MPTWINLDGIHAMVLKLHRPAWPGSSDGMPTWINLDGIHAMVLKLHRPA